MMLGVGYQDRVGGIVLNDIGPEADPAGLERIKSHAGRLPPPKDWRDAIAQTRSLFGDTWPNLSEARWSRIARRGYRQDASGQIRGNADPMIGEMLRAAPPATATLRPFWGALRVAIDTFLAKVQ